MEILYPDYDNRIANLACSVMEHFGDKFMLMSKAEVMERRLFGKGEPHPRFDEVPGDYVAVAVDNISIYNKSEKNFIGAHAGLTKDEMIIPLIAVKK